MTKVYSNDKSGKLFDALKAEFNIASDRKLAEVLGVKPPVISKIRCGKLPVGATLILRAHEEMGIEVTRIRELIAA